MKSILFFLGVLLSNTSSELSETQTNTASGDFFTGYEELFLDISGMSHIFPEDVRKLDFPVTLLHKHPHAHGYLVFSENYTESNYEDNVDGQHPCSWHLDQDKQPKPYEYCEQNNDYNITEVKGRLDKLADLGYTNYGTTVRSINNKVELETDEGHVYVKMDDDKYRKDQFFSETSVYGSRYDDCVWLIGCIENIFRDHEKGGTRHELDPPTV